MLKRIAIAMGGVLLFCGLAGFAWFFVRLQQQHRATVGELQETTKVLTAQHEQLSMLESEHRKLSESYDTLKGRWSATGEELAALQQHAEQTAQELARMRNERTEVQRAFEKSTSQTAALTQQVHSLEQTLQQQTQATQASTQAQTEQFAQAHKELTQAYREEARLKEQLAELSRAYETAIVQSGQPAQRQGEVPRAPATVRKEASASRLLNAMLKDQPAAEPALTHPSYVEANELPRSSNKLLWRWLTDHR